MSPFLSFAGFKYFIVIRKSFYMLPFSHSFALLFTYLICLCVKFSLYFWINVNLPFSSIFCLGTYCTCVCWYVIFLSFSCISLSWPTSVARCCKFFFQKLLEDELVLIQKWCFSHEPRSCKIFGLLFKRTCCKKRSVKNRPIWSHCYQPRYMCLFSNLSLSLCLRGYVTNCLLYAFSRFCV